MSKIDPLTIAILSFVVGFGVGMVLMNHIWIRRIRDWRHNTLIDKITRAEEALARLRGRHGSAKTPRARAQIFAMIADQADHLRNLRGQVQGFENLLRWHAGDDFDPEAPPVSDVEVARVGKAADKPYECPSELAVGSRLAVAKPIAVHDPSSSIIDFDALRKHPKGCTCDTCWPDDPVLYSNEALEEAIKNGAVVTAGEDEKK